MVLTLVCGAQWTVAMSDVVLVLRYTRRWIQYGVFAHTIVCTMIAAIEGVLGR